MSARKLALAVVIAFIVILYFVGGGEKYFSTALYQDIYERSPGVTIVVFFVVFFIGTSCSLPVAGVLSIASGIVFGAMTGFLISLTAATLGGTLACYSTRYLFEDLVKRRFPGQLAVVNKGVEKDGAFYLFGLRMIPVIPFGLLNLLIGLTSMPVCVFMIATLLGMAPVVLILSYAGSQLGGIESLGPAAIFTPGVIFSLLLLASFPFIAKAVVAMIRRFKASDQR